MEDLKLEQFYKDTFRNSKASSIIIYDLKSQQILGDFDNIEFNTMSIAKTVLAISFGLLMKKTNNRYNLDTYVFPKIMDKIKVMEPKYLKFRNEVKVKHLLTHTTGFNKPLLMSKDISGINKENLLDYCFMNPLIYKPGIHFQYSNAGYYILSVFMETVLGDSLYDFINKNLFEKLNIINPKWEFYGKYIVGASKLYFSDRDLLKIGELLLNKGKYLGINLIEEKYISQMMSPIIKTNISSDLKYLRQSHYGLGMWVGEEDVRFLSGTGGQIVAILLDEKKIILATNRGEACVSSLIKKDVDSLIAYIKGD